MSGREQGARLGQPSGKPDVQVAVAFARFAGGFWRGPDCRRAWLLTAALAGALVLSLGATVAMNRWQRWFFDALENRDVTTAGWAVFTFIGIVAVMATIGVLIVIARETLQVRWREWLVKRVTAHWLHGNRFYHLATTSGSPDNPEYRIADDSRWATEPLVDLAIGLFSSIIGAAAFISILWSVGGALHLKVGDTPVTIPAYMVLAAITYGALMSGLMLWIGRPLVACVARKNAAEGEFRFSLMRVRENAESVALMDGATAETQAMSRAYDTVVARWLAIVRQHANLTWVTNAAGPMVPIVPIVFAAPKYLQGELSLGEVMQLGTAFVQVQLAISWIVDNFSRIAEWLASARRVVDLVEACDAVGAVDTAAAGRLVIERHDGASVVFSGVAITTTSGDALIGADDLTLPPGSHVWLTGPASSGKSMLVRTLAGLWPWGKGTVRLPVTGRIIIAPQRGYTPDRPLRDVLSYPAPPESRTREAISLALVDVGLAHLVPRIDATERWEQTLSFGERQRLTIARILLHRPDVVVLDDSLSAMDETARESLESIVRTRLASSTVISIGHPPPSREDAAIWLEFERVGPGFALRRNDISSSAPRTTQSTQNEAASKREPAPVES